MLLKLAWRNIWRNKHRTYITAGSIFFAVMLSIVMSSLQIGVYDNLIKNVVGFYTGYIQVHNGGYWEEKTLDNGFDESQELSNNIQSLDEVLGITPRIESFVLASSGDVSKGTIITGIDPEKEGELTELNRKVIEGDYLMPGDGSVLISEGLAEYLNLKLHDTVVLLGQGYHGSMAAGKYDIKGIVKFGSPELNENSVFLTIDEAQILFSAEDILTSYVISVKDTRNLEEIKSLLADRIGAEYEVLTWKEMLPEIDQYIRVDKASFVITLGVLYMIVSFGIFGTVLVMTMERRYEFGVMLAIGMKRIKLGFMLIFEIINISFIGVISGMIVSIPIVAYLAANPIRLTGELAKTYERFGFEPVLPASTDPMNFIYQGIIIFIICAFISQYPLLKILRLEPVKAMKQ